jgi:hypothetical protein
VLDLKVEIASVAREMPLSIQQYQIVGLGSPQISRHLEAIGRINPNALTPEDASVRVAGGPMGVDEENLLVIENRAGTKWWWLVHTKLRKPKRIVEAWADSPPGRRGSQGKWKSPKGQSGLPFSFHDVGLFATAARINLARRRILHWRLALFPRTSRGWKLRSSSQRMT